MTLDCTPELWDLIFSMLELHTNELILNLSLTIFYKKLLLLMLQGCWDHLRQTTAWWKKSLLNFPFFQSFTFYMSSAKKISYHQQKHSWHCLTVLYCLEVLYFKWVYNYIFPSFFAPAVNKLLSIHFLEMQQSKEDGSAEYCWSHPV